MIAAVFVLATTIATYGTGPASQPASQPAERAGHTMLEHDSLDDLNLLLNLEVPTVITATRREQKITSVPYAVTVITREDMRSAGVRSVPDALRLAPGVDVAELASNSYAVSPRGFNGITAYRTLVLVDGRQIYDSLFGGTLWGSWAFQIENIERIEVIRGPGGVTWGANTVNGVINIITRDPGDQPGLTLYGRGGARGAASGYAGYAFQEDKLKLRVSGAYERHDGFNSGGSWLMPLDDGYRNPQMEVSGVYEAGPQDRISFSGGSSVVEDAFPPGLLSGLDPLKRGSQASFMLGKWEHKFADDNVLELTGYVNDLGLHASALTDYRYQQLALQMSHTFNWSEQHTLIWGIDTRTDLVDASNADPRMLSKDFVSTPTVGLYVQDEWRFAPRWRLNLGGRIDYDAYGGFNPSARGALSYDLTETSTLYTAVSRAFTLLPSAMRFADGPVFGGLLMISADRDYSATSALAYEVGYHGRFFDRLDLNVNTYWNETDNELYFTPRLGPPGLIAMEVDNRPSSSAYGIEVDAKYEVTKQFQLLGNYTFQRLDYRGAGYVTSNDAITPPANKFMFGARYSPRSDLHLSSTLYYADNARSPNTSFPLVARGVDAYLRLDLRAEWDFWKERGSLAVGVRNLLDPQHFEGASLFANQAEVPRMVYAEMRLRLN